MPPHSDRPRRQVVAWSGPIPRKSADAQSLQSPAQLASLQHACLCAKIADDYRGKDTVVLDLSRVTPVFDYFVLTTGASRRQMRAIAEEVDRVLSAEGSQRIGGEGLDGETWILQDYGDVVLHVFAAETRGVYDLEHLWSDAERVDWRAFLERSAQNEHDEHSR